MLFFYLNLFKYWFNKGFVTHYNFLLEHSYLGYTTPAMVSGMGEGIHNWENLIELAYGY